MTHNITLIIFICFKRDLNQLFLDEAEKCFCVVIFCFVRDFWITERITLYLLFSYLEANNCL